VPVFAVTHDAGDIHDARDIVVTEGETAYAFITGGIEIALAQAQAAAGGKDVVVRPHISSRQSSRPGRFASR
jgi:hypothetical protein